MSSIRRQVTIAAAPRAVWQALASADGLQAWLCDEARVDPRAGGRVTVRSEGDDGEPVVDTGTLLVCRPTSKLEIAWDKTGNGPWKGTTTQFSVALDGDETVVNLLHAGSPLEDEEARGRLDTEWRRALASLRDGLE
jgi:uncharacterized protein YndB with AHSA1/START domain